MKGFEKVYVNPDETKTVRFKLGYDELKIYSARGKYEVEEAPVNIMVGSNPEFTAENSDTYSAADIGIKSRQVQLNELARFLLTLK